MRPRGRDEALTPQPSARRIACGSEQAQALDSGIVDFRSGSGSQVTVSLCKRTHQTGSVIGLWNRTAHEVGPTREHQPDGIGR
jgi:hypothetical protein